MSAPDKRGVLVAVVVGAAVAVACGGTSDALFGHPPSTLDGGENGGDGSTGTFTMATDGSLPFDAFAACATTTEKATELPLDLYLMLDTSGSMNDLVAAKESKWNAVSSALTTFVNDPASAGIGVGLQYFPLPAAGVSASCTSDSQCGPTGGPCFFKACDLTTFSSVVPCDTSTDCNGSPCETVGECSNDVNTVCPPGTDCGPDSNGFDLGTCKTIVTSTCADGDSCTAQDYATPAVPIALLPGAASAISASLAAHTPNGNTPTSQALQGALDEAKTFALANPGRSVVAVLATDGIPDECTPDDTTGIAAIATAGLAGSPSIKTFTIGVFTPDDVSTGTATLNQIASAGGTTQAFIIQSTSSDVETQFAAALTSIRGASLPCEYQVPEPEAGTPDYARVNVQYISGAGASSGVPYVETEAKCGTSTGWYYDVDPSGGATPNAIIVCPSTCSTLQKDAKGQIDVLVGCATVTR